MKDNVFVDLANVMGFQETLLLYGFYNLNLENTICQK
jgi:hypothetical protein